MRPLPVACGSHSFAVVLFLCHRHPSNTAIEPGPPLHSAPGLVRHRWVVRTARPSCSSSGPRLLGNVSQAPAVTIRKRTPCFGSAFSTLLTSAVPVLGYGIGYSGPIYPRGNGNRSYSAYYSTAARQAIYDGPHRHLEEGERSRLNGKVRRSGGQWRIRTPEARRRPVYSRSPLSAWVTARSNGVALL